MLMKDSLGDRVLLFITLLSPGTASMIIIAPCQNSSGGNKL